MTQDGLAQASGLPLGSIRNYEQGQREPYWAVVFKLAAALGVSSEEFKDCAGIGEKAPPAKGRPRKAGGAVQEGPAGGRGQGRKQKGKKGPAAKE
jgi:transcriptional regulator with XRE-family HTH domain